MKKMYLLLIATIFIVACSDDTTTNPDNESSFKPLNYPLDRGNEWIYEEVFTDHDGNITEISGNMEQHKVGDFVEYQGRKGYQLIKTKIYAGADSESDTTLLFNDSTGLYEYDHNFEDRVRQDFPNASVGWARLVDYSKDSWVSYENSIDTIIGSEQHYYQIKITGKKVGTRKITIEDIEYTGIVFNITKEYSGFYSSQDRDYKMSYEIVIIDNLGMYKKTEIGTSGYGSWGLQLTSFKSSK